MNNRYVMLINMLFCFITFFISYQLALAFIGVSFPLKKILSPIILFSIIAYISKSILNTSASIQTILVVIMGTLLLYFFNQIPIILSLIASLLSFTTLTLGSMLLACPVFVRLGYAIPLKITGLTGTFLTLLELIIPTLVLVILKKINFSFMKYINSVR